MSIAESLLPEFDLEMANTRKVLERVPKEKLGWKIHEKSNTIGWVANHLADIPGWIPTTFQETSFDVDPDGKGEPISTLDDPQAILGLFDKNVSDGRAVLESVPDEAMDVPWSLLQRGEVLFTMPRISVYRISLMNHIVHHRGHLCVYLRVNDIPVPGMYGPSADDLSFG